MDAILKTLSLEMNKNRRNKIYAMIKQLKMREYSAHFDFSLNCYVLVIFNWLLVSCSIICLVKDKLVEAWMARVGGVFRGLRRCWQWTGSREMLSGHWFRHIFPELSSLPASVNFPRRTSDPVG